jgi:hypothetical protein
MVDHLIDLLDSSRRSKRLTGGVFRQGQMSFRPRLRDHHAGSLSACLVAGADVPARGDGLVKRSVKLCPVASRIVSAY